MTDTILALDFGGTKASAGVVEPGRRVWRARQVAAVPTGAEAATDLAHMLDLARSVLAGERPSAIGVSFGGPVDFDAQMVRLSYHIPGWEGIPLADRLQSALRAPAIIDNDGNVAALGEQRFGAGQGCASLLYLTVSTGVGGGWVLGRRVWRGHHGLAGEIGHMTIDPDGPICDCGRRGCVERLASGPWLARRARELLEARPDRGARLRARVGGVLDTVDARAVAAAAEEGDELAWEVLRAAAEALGIAIGNAQNLMDPERVVVGGGVSKAGGRYWVALRAAAQARAMAGGRCEILPAALGDEAPLWGAVALAQDHLRGD